ncbi:efflux RND transporter periplasmic adaptor subunit [Marinobacter salexigens]|uniref:efflux RND transporter periplasmic adaptor subunit n=1 Tax=Marinobacter salexigens TaxID=1925763 RepID=UPI000C2935E7|nr:efflux RND transporter periplasmic adaptor subunit [Marinobacter salexigens]
MNLTLRIAFYALATIILVGCSEPEKATSQPVIQPVKVMTIGSEDATLVREFPGTVRASQRVTMAFQVPGRLVEFPVRESQTITKGTLLARLDPSDYNSNFSAARTQMTTAEANFKRAKDLIEKKYISQAEYDKIESSYNVAQTEFEKARKALNETRLIAPFEGVIARTFVDNFQEVQPKEPILNLQNNRELEVVVDIPENLIVRYSSTGGRIDLSARFDGIPNRSFPLAIKEHATEASPDTQTFQYVLSFEDTAGQNLLPGMTAIVRAQRKSDGGNGETLIAVPLSAVVADSNRQKVVWIINDDNRVSKRPVETGDLVGSSSILITSGLHTGDTLATAGASSLTEGMQVKPIHKVEF